MCVTDNFLPTLPQTETMRTSEFDSSSDEEDVCEEHLTPFQISWQVAN